MPKIYLPSNQIQRQPQAQPVQQQNQPQISTNNPSLINSVSIGDIDKNLIEMGAPGSSPIPQDTQTIQNMKISGGRPSFDINLNPDEANQEINKALRRRYSEKLQDIYFDIYKKKQESMPIEKAKNIGNIVSSMGLIEDLGRGISSGKYGVKSFLVNPTLKANLTNLQSLVTLVRSGAQASDQERAVLASIGPKLTDFITSAMSGSSSKKEMLSKLGNLYATMKASGVLYVPEDSLNVAIDKFKQYPQDFQNRIGSEQEQDPMLNNIDARIRELEMKANSSGDK